MGDVIDFPGATAIEGSPEMRVRKCQQQVENILKFYRCALHPVVVIDGVSISSVVKIIAIPDEVKADGKEPPEADK